MKIIRVNEKDLTMFKKDILNLFEQSHYMSFPNLPYEEVEGEQRFYKLIDYVRNGSAIVYSAIYNETLMGFIWFFEKMLNNKKIIHINSFISDKNFRRQGIGRALWDEVEKYTYLNNIIEIELYVTKNNLEAVSFYEKRDFIVERLFMKKRIK